jgi:thiamine-phosphate pyrophosphorylase
MLRYYVTGDQPAHVVVHAATAINQGVEMIQVRAKDLPAVDFLKLVTEIANLAEGTTTKVLVNDRLDIAIAAGVRGVHLPAHGLPAERVRSYVDILGVSTHSLAEAVNAERAGADFIVFGPIFETPGKTPVGLGPLRDVVSAIKIPVLGIGGIDKSNMKSVLETGAAGIAAIRLFQIDSINR